MQQNLNLHIEKKRLSANLLFLITGVEILRVSIEREAENEIKH